MEDGEEDEAVEDDDYEDDGSTEAGSTDEDEEDGNGDGDGVENRLQRACSPDTCDAPSGYSSLIGRSREAISRLELLLYHLQRLAGESEAKTGQRAMLHHQRSRCPLSTLRLNHWSEISL